MILRLLTLFLLLSCFCEAKELVAVLCATSEIGQEVTAALKREKLEPLLIGRNSAKLHSLCSQYDCQGLEIDLSVDDFSQLDAYLDPKVRVNGVVLITPRPAWGKGVLPEESAWLDMFRLCFTRPLEVLKRLHPFMNDDAQVVILSGTTSVHAMPAYASYGVLRKMWLAEAKSLARELGRGICVNTVSPGVVATKRHMARWQAEASANHISLDNFLKKKVADYPAGKLTTPKDVAEAILFFLKGGSNANAQNLVIDGGVSPVY